MKLALIFAVLAFLLEPGVAAGHRRITACQEVSTWQKSNGWPVAHQGVYLFGPNVVISLQPSGVSIDKWSKSWESDEPSVTAAHGINIEYMKTLAGMYAWSSNNCIHYKNRVLDYCEKGY